MEWNVSVCGINLGNATDYGRFDLIKKAIDNGRITREMAEQDTNFRLTGYAILTPKSKTK